MCRSKRRSALWITTAAVVVVAAVGLYLFQPWKLFTTDRVDEAPPAAAGRQGGTVKQVANGAFVSHEHETTGSVEVQQLAEGKATLRLTNLRTSDGPAVHVWLSDQPVRKGGGNLGTPTSSGRRGPRSRRCP
ncbi:hypothetical protein EF912_13165 [Streptomyces sp. WAC07061]|uniref:DM13 domain-containing protein n=1 Tax=Streptomyces sp. WAC07061 TaxID=2487410 RepID=UPI000F7BA254|nr:DM13 domain-containing protein [Streptomyces sp. WAC07061]RSS57798.1 hypothetical protein EF912_13165 [Streptomyces sp. WAC07061]